MHHSRKLQAIKILTITFWFSTAVFLLAGCKAAPEPDSGFIKDPEQMQANKDMPFNAIWLENDLNWANYTEILIRPVDTTHLEKMSWWDKASIANESITPQEEAEVLASYMQEEMIKAYTDDPKHYFTVVDTAGPKTLILELALVEVVPTKVWLNTIGYVILGALDFGSTAMEGRLKNHENKIIAKFKDREHGQMAIVSVADLQWYSHSHHTINHWSEKLVAITDSTPGEEISADWTVTLRPW